MAATVVVVGGGYGGIVVARALDESADVVLVEPRDAFHHNFASLRAAVDPAWPDRIFLPYDGLLRRGRLVRDRAVRVDADSVTLGSGERLAADYIVLATGSTYPYPAKTVEIDSDAAKAMLRATRATLERARGVLLLGAGPVGLEFAGEIKAAWPDKAVTIVDPAQEILVGEYGDELRAELRRQLTALGVELALGTVLHEEPPVAAGELAPFTAITESGLAIGADVWFRCHGVVPVSDYLADDLAMARQPSGHLEVTDDLRLAGQQRVFAIGDLTAVPEPKTGKAAAQHAALVAANIQTLVDGGTELAAHTPGPPSIVVPLGPRGGATYVPETGVLDAATTSELKSADLMTGRCVELLRVGDAVTSGDVANAAPD